MSLLKQNIIRKSLIIKKKLLKLKLNNDKKYKVKIIWDSKIYINKVIDNLPSLYYLIFWNSYIKSKNI